jgi:hypothetical protein
LRLANPLVALVLRSPVHRLLSGTLLLVTYRGHATGRSFTIPVMYAPAADRLVAVATRPEQKLWWRSFAMASPATVRLRGETVPVEGRVLDGEARDVALDAYLTRYPRARRSVEGGAAVVAFEPVRR